MLNLENIDLVNSTGDQVKVFCYSFFIWTSIFAVVNQKVHLKSHTKKVQDDIKNRIVSIIHGAVTFWAATYIVVFEKPGFGTPNSQAMQFAMIISASYFVYDFLGCLYYDLADMSLVSHHSLAICGYAVATFAKLGAPSSIWGLMCAEVSNFPMHMRVILRQLGLRYTKLYEACEWTYFALYIIFRGTLVPYMVYYTWPETDVPLLVKLTATGLFLQSVYFIFEYQFDQFKNEKNSNQIILSAIRKKKEKHTSLLVQCKSKNIRVIIYKQLKEGQSILRQQLYQKKNMNPNNNYMFYPQGQIYPQYNIYPPNYVFQPQMQPQFYYMNPPQAQTMYQPYLQTQQSQQRIKCNQPKTKDQPERQQQPIKQQPSQQAEVQKSSVKVVSEAVINKQISSITRQGFCHYCNKNGKICYYCFSICAREESSASFNSECRHGFCFDCLIFKFKINPIKIVLRQDWSCPVKNKQCNCSRCTNLIHMDSDQFISNDSVESCNKYAHIIENTKRIKKQYTKKKGIIRETFAMKFHQLDPKKKKQQQSAKKNMILVKLKKQMQFSQECILKLKQQLNPADEQILHQVVRYNFEQLIELIKEYKSA